MTEVGGMGQPTPRRESGQTRLESYERLGSRGPSTEQLAVKQASRSAQNDKVSVRGVAWFHEPE